MMTQQIFKKLELFSTLMELPIIILVDPFGDGENYYFMVWDFTEYNPSNHIHSNYIRKGKLINTVVSSPMNVDKDLLKVSIEELHFSSLRFNNSTKWLKIS